MKKQAWFFGGLVVITLAFSLVVSWVSLLAQPNQPRGEKYALIVGVQDYSGTSLSNLKYCDNDAHALAELLTEAQLGWKAGNVTVLTQRAAFKKENKKLLPRAANIRSWLKTLKNYQAEDTLLVAFSGHGVHLKKFKDRGLFFCPEECDLDKPETLVSLSDIYEQLEKCPAKVKLLFMDACRNDPGDGKGAEDRLESVTRPLVPDPKGGIAAFFSCRTGEKSYESDTLKHGIFTYHVLKGLGGEAVDGDGEVTIPTLENYLTKKVPQAVVKDRGNPDLEQTPERRGKIVGSVVLSKAGGGDTDDVIESKTLRGLKLKRIVAKGKSFTMGSPESEKGRFDNETEHTVRFSRDFYMGVTHVTRGQFAAFVKATEYKTEGEADGKGGWAWDGKEAKQDPKYTWRSPGFFEQGDDHPVVQVSWNDARAFCKWLSEKDGREYRLPTESEWEYACRAGTQTAYYFGNDEEKLGDYAWYKENSGSTTHAVAGKKVNAWNLYDMHGNAWQWCSDKYGDYPKGEVTDPQGSSGEGSFRVRRGGGWLYSPRLCRAASRDWFVPTFRDDYLGFRLAVSVRQ